MPITILKDLTPELAEEFRKAYDEMCVTGINGFKLQYPSPDFDENGLRFDVDYLNMIGTDIALLPLELMAEYADKVTKNCIDNNSKAFIELLENEPDIIESFNDNRLNATTIGNMAYIIINCTDKKVKENQLKNLERIYERVKGRFLDALSGVM